MNYKELKEKFPNKKERRGMFFTWLKMRIKELWWKFKDTQFIAHISFLWHWKNFFFCLKYPFYKARNVWSGKFSGYSFTWYDEIPSGWQKAFGKQLSKEIKEAGIKTRKRLKKHVSWKEMLYWTQIKEKWGELCLYANASDEIHEVLTKYEHISSGYCICCGKPAKYITKGWVSFQCEDCFEKNDCWKYKDGEKVPLNEDEMKKHKEECRLTKEDIPTFYYFEDKTQIERKINTKEKYGVDFEELWGLK